MDLAGDPVHAFRHRRHGAWWPTASRGRFRAAVRVRHRALSQPAHLLRHRRAFLPWGESRTAGVAGDVPPTVSADGIRGAGWTHAAHALELRRRDQAHADSLPDSRALIRTAAGL